jgi:hypothetical protein
MLILLLSAICFSYGMISDGIHSPADYEKFTGMCQEYDSACHIYDPISSTMMTGVLIHPRIVMTAAHGIVPMLEKRGIKNQFSDVMPMKNIQITFSSCLRASKAVAIDLRYLRFQYGLENHHDMAFILLDDPIHNIPIAPLLAEGYIPKVAPLSVITWSISDEELKSIFSWSFFSKPIFSRSRPRKRGFMLCEFDLFYPSSLDGQEIHYPHNFLVSSIFFNPNPKPLYLKSSSESSVRNCQAYNNWVKWNKPPYAMAISGTSGAPVFVDINGQKYLFGIVVSFSGMEAIHKFNLEPKKLIKKPIEDLYENYQTIIALIYKKSPDPKMYKKDFFYIQPDMHKHMLIRMLLNY